MEIVNLVEPTILTNYSEYDTSCWSNYEFMTNDQVKDTVQNKIMTGKPVVVVSPYSMVRAVSYQTAETNKKNIHRFKVWTRVPMCPIPGCKTLVYNSLTVGYDTGSPEMSYICSRCGTRTEDPELYKSKVKAIMIYDLQDPEAVVKDVRYDHYNKNLL